MHRLNIGKHDGEVLLTDSIPHQAILDAIGGNQADRFFSGYNTYVPSGDIELEEGFVWRVFGSQTRNDTLIIFEGSDGDGVVDSSDAIPADSNETLDTDGDGIGDACDYPSMVVAD